jgi:hypothetical protein
MRAEIPEMPSARARRHGRLRRPMIVAMCLSCGLHALLLVFGNLTLQSPWPTDARSGARPLELVIANPGIAEDAETPSNGTVSPEAVSSDVDAGAADRVPSLDSRHREVAAEAGEPTESTSGDELTAGQSAPAQFESSPRRSAPGDEPLHGSLVAPDATQSSDDDDAVAVVTTETPAARTAVLSARQQKMLARRLEDWAATFERRFEADDEVTWKHDGQRYTARFVAAPVGDDTGLDRLAIEVTTDQDGRRLSTVMHMKRLAFSNYAQFVNRWDEAVQIHDDELDGRFHSNSTINLTYSRKARPTFRGKVTTSARTINVARGPGSRRRDDIFLAGVETGVRSIRLPRDFIPLPESLDVQDEQVQRFPEDTRITFHADGSYSWVSLESGLFERRGTIRAPASYLLAEGKARLEVRGVVNGKVLLYSRKRITITGDLVYAADPETDPEADDYLGIVAEGSVEIAPPKVTGPGDLRIQAAIYARARFRVRDYHRRGDGTLDIYGSLTAGSLSATEPRFATRIRFDPRLEERRPPGFPETDRYELVSWESAWVVNNNPAP